MRVWQFEVAQNRLEPAFMRKLSHPTCCVDGDSK